MKHCILLLLLVGFSAADMVITASEAIACSVLQADSTYLRLKMPQGGARMLPTKDVIEVRLADSARAVELAAQMPWTRIALQSGTVIQPGEVQAEVLEAAQQRPDAVGSVEPPAGQSPATHGVSGPRQPFAGFTALVSGAVSGTFFEGVSTWQLAPSVVLFPVSWLGLGADLSLASVDDGDDREQSISVGAKAVLLFGQRSRSYLGAGVGTLRVEERDGVRSGRRIKFAFGGLAYAHDHIVVPIEAGLMFDRLGDESGRTIVGVLGLGLAGLLY